MTTTFEAVVHLTIPKLGSFPLTLLIAVPAGENEVERANTCARVVASAMLNLRGGNG